MQCFHLYSKLLFFRTKLKKVHENGHLEVVALKSWHQHRRRNRHSKYNYSLLHSINRLQRQKLVLYIFIKQVIFTKVVTYRLEACDFLRKVFAKKSRRKFLDNFKRATVQNRLSEKRKVVVLHKKLLRVVRKPMLCQ